MVLLSSLGTRRRGSPYRALGVKSARGRAARLGTQRELVPVLAVAALGSVAFLLWQALRRPPREPDRGALLERSRAGASALPADAPPATPSNTTAPAVTASTVTRASTSTSLGPGALIRPPPPPAGDAKAAAWAAIRARSPGGLPRDLAHDAARAARTATLATEDQSERDVSLTLRWVQRASRAVLLNEPPELRRLALEIQNEGHEVEAALLVNYALLLERSRASGPRVLREVTRLLEQGWAERRAGRAAALSESPGTSAAGSPLVPMPAVASGARRRAG